MIQFSNKKIKIRMKYVFLLLVFLASVFNGFSQFVFKTNQPQVHIVFDQQEIVLPVLPESHLQVIPVDCHQQECVVTIADAKDTMSINIQPNQTIDLHIVKDTLKIAVKLVGEIPNITFSPEYIQRFRGKNKVEIPQVSELINILLVLHKDAEKDKNMFDTESEYYRRVKEYFAPYRNHRAVEIIQQNMPSPNEISEGMYLFPIEAYQYYYVLKINSVAYDFDSEGKIKNQGFAKQVGKQWEYPFDPMRDVLAFEDFAKVSNFRKFYQDNKVYYQELLDLFHRLSPIDKMKNWLEQKFSTQYDSFRIYFSALNKAAQATTSFEQNDFKQGFVFIAKPIEYQEHSAVLNELLSSWIVFTEIDHNYVNPLSDIFLKIIEKFFSNREKWAKGVGTEMYSDAYAVFNEYMTFALFTLYANDYYSQDEVQKFLSMYEPMMENVRGFIRFKEFNRVLLEKYQQDSSIKMPYLYVHMLQWAKNINNN